MEIILALFVFIQSLNERTQLTLSPACRTSSITVTASLALGGVTVTGSRVLSVEWLVSVAVELYYQDATDAQAPLDASGFRTAGPYVGQWITRQVFAEGKVVGTSASGREDLRGDASRGRRGGSRRRRGARRG